ncbi:cell cycle associated protein caprin family member [Haemaphysalis longicornis]
MPSAAAKIEKQASSEGQDSLKSIVTIFEKKTRNLEKRKGKLDHLKKELEQGKELNEDQKAAVGKYDQVLETLELTRELQKSVTAVVQEHLRQSKRQARREQLERQAREAQRVRELLELQDVLVALGTPATRQCFLEGTEGATRLTEEALDRFDQLFQLTCPSREDCASPAAFQANLLQAAEHLVALLDARPKPLLGTTYKALREVLLEVQQSEYFMGAAPEDAASAEAPAATSVSEEDAEPREEEDPQDQAEQQSPPTEDASPVSEVPELSTESQQQQLQQPEVQQVPPMPVVAAVAVPNAVREVEPTPIIPVVPMVAVTTAAPPPLLPSDAVPEAVVAEVVPAGRLDFFQESQIDLESPHMDPAVVAALPSVPPPTLPPPPAAALMQVTTGYVLGHPPPPQHAAALHQPLAPPHTVSAPAPPPQQQPPSLVAATPPMDFVMEQHMPIPTQTFTNQSLRNNDLDRRPPRRGGGGGGPPRGGAPRHAGGYANGKGSGQQWQSNGSGHDRSDGYRGPPRQAGSGPRGPYQGRGRPAGGRAPPRNAGVPAAAAAYAQ